MVMIGVFFVLLLFLTKRKNFFPSIHQVGGGNIGAPLFPLGLLVCAIIFWEINPLIFQGAVLIVGLSDGLAGILGQRFGKHSYYITGYKTIEGSLLFFLITLSILLSAFFYYKHSISPSLIFFAVISSLVLSFIEGFFGRGWDNLFIPPCAGLMIYLGFKFIL